MDKALVSIVIPTFNRAKWLDQAIASAAGQSYGELEILICDNASTDDTPGICADWAARDARIRVVRHQHNLGMIGNWKEAFGHHARGDWVVILSDDDYFVAPDYIDRAAQHFRETGIGLIYAEGEFLDESSGASEHLVLPALGRIVGRNAFVNYGRGIPQAFMLCNILFNREKSLQSWPDMFCFSWNYASDGELFLRLCLDHDVVALPGPSTICRRHSSNASLVVEKVPELAWGQLWGQVAPVELAMGRGIAEADALLELLPLDTLLAHYLFVRMCADFADAYRKLQFIKLNAPIMHGRLKRQPLMETQQVVGAALFGRNAPIVLENVGKVTKKLRNLFGRPKKSRV